MTRPDSIRNHRRREGETEKMGRRKQVVVLIGLAMSMAIGLAVYLRLWIIDYRISSDETELIRNSTVFFWPLLCFATICASLINEATVSQSMQLATPSRGSLWKQPLYFRVEARRQFDLANREAMDESAYWRGRYDEEAEKVNNCQQELLQVKKTSASDDDRMDSKLESLQKENRDLLEKIKALERVLASEKLKCNRTKP